MINGMTAIGETVQFAAKAIIAIVVVVGGLWFYATECVYTEASESYVPRVETTPSELTSARSHFDDVY